MMPQSQLSVLRSQLIDRRSNLVAYRQELRSSWENLNREETDVLDQANLNSTMLDIARLDERSWKEILDIDEVMEKMAQELYGICEFCEEDIAVERIRVLPYARFCIECAEKQERNGVSWPSPRQVHNNDQCRESSVALSEAIAENGQIQDEIDIQCINGQLVVTGALSKKSQYFALKSIIKEMPPDPIEPIVDVALDTTDDEALVEDSD